MSERSGGTGKPSQNLLRPIEELKTTWSGRLAMFWRACCKPYSWIRFGNSWTRDTTVNPRSFRQGPPTRKRRCS